MFNCFFRNLVGLWKPVSCNVYSYDVKYNMVDRENLISCQVVKHTYTYIAMDA